MTIISRIWKTKVAYVATDKTITNINLPSTLKTISAECFSRCSELIFIELPDSLTSIGNKAFSGCTAIKELYIPASVVSVGSQILYNCENTIIKCAATEKPSDWSDSFNEYSYKDLKVYWNSGRLSGETNGFAWRTSADGELIIDSYDGNATTVTFPVVEGYTLLKIPSQLFYNHSEIKYLTIPSSVTEIGYAALYGCNGLINLTLPSVCSVVELFNTSSSYWNRVSTPESLNTITFNGGEKIFSSSLYNCTHIQSVTIPATIKTIGTNAFSGCTSLTYVKFASPTGWKYRTYSYTYGESFYQIPESSLSSTSNAATLLKDTYDSYEWRKD